MTELAYLQIISNIKSILVSEKVLYKIIIDKLCILLKQNSENIFFQKCKKNANESFILSVSLIL